MFLRVSVLCRTSQEFCALVYFSQTVVKVLCLFSYLFRISLKSILEDLFSNYVKSRGIFPLFPIENLVGFSNETLKNLKLLDCQFLKHILSIKICSLSKLLKAVSNFLKELKATSALLSQKGIKDIFSCH